MPEPKYDHYPLRHGSHGCVDVLGWGTYPSSSVLAGQPMKVFIDSYSDEEEARKDFPQVTGFSSKWTEPQVSLSHLPDESTPCAGGMYPDDWDDGAN